MMQLDFDDTVLLGLHGYVRSVCRALGLRGECSYVQGDAPVSAYVALDERLRRFPDHDVALVWDEHHGWSAAIETHSGDELPVVAALGRDLLPAPETVAAWALAVRTVLVGCMVRHTFHGEIVPVLTESEILVQSAPQLAAFVRPPSQI